MDKTTPTPTMMRQPSQQIDYIAILRRRLHWLIWPMVSVFFVTLLVAVSLPNVYKSWATILIDAKQISEGLVASTVTTYADQRIQSIKQELLSRSKLLDLVEKYDLFPDVRKKISTDALVKKLTDAIRVEPLSAQVTTGRSDRPSQVTIAFKLSYEGEDPSKVQKMTSDLASFFLAKNLQARQDSAKGTTKFIEKQLEKVRDTLAELDGKLAVFKEKHMEELPEFLSLNIRKLEKNSDRINSIEREITSLRSQRASANTRLTSLDPYSGSGRVMSDEEKRQELELKLTEYKAKYSDSHPKIKALERELSLLQQGQPTSSQNLSAKRNKKDELEQELALLRSKYSEEHPLVKKKSLEIEQLDADIKASADSNATGAGRNTAIDLRNVTNPTYLDLHTELEQLDIQLASLESEKRTLAAEEKEIYTKLEKSPIVEKEYKELLMDRDSAKSSIEDLQKKLQVAKVSEGMEEGQLGETFTMTEAPFLPDQPDKPNRLAIIILGLVLSTGASFGVAAIKEYTDHSIWQPAEVENLTGYSVLATIPRVYSPSEQRKRRKKMIAIPIAVSVALIIGTTIFHFFVMDLYIFYDKLFKLLSNRFFIYF